MNTYIYTNSEHAGMQRAQISDVYRGNGALHQGVKSPICYDRAVHMVQIFLCVMKRA